MWDHDGQKPDVPPRSRAMSKRARKRRARKNGGANHGKRPNA